jgi:predicted trehalose synthase
MTENSQNLVLELLRSIRGDIATIKDDIRELKSRVGNVEIGVASIRRDLGQLATDDAEQHVRFDRLTERVERIEKRLDLTN